jgi:PII-like signaling protein
MAQEGLKLSAYAGERDRAGGRLLADALMDIFARHRIHASALFRGIEGFGIKHRLQTERLLTLSEDLPVLATAVDGRARIEEVMAEVASVSRHGLITLERVLLVTGNRDAVELAPGQEELKLTVYLGRQERADGRPAHLAVVEALHRRGVAGASVLLGVDGTAAGVRRRGRFFARNAEVPAIVLSVGTRESIARALPDLRAMLTRPVMTIERVRVCKRDGALLARPADPPPAVGERPAHWQKLTVIGGGRSEFDGRPLHAALIRRLREEGAAGATALRGHWGYHGEHLPHGESFWSLRRHVPVLTVLLDTPANMRRWFEIVDEVTAQTGLVTSELVPALRAAGPDIEHGALSLAEPRVPPMP